MRHPQMTVLALCLLFVTFNAFAEPRDRAAADALFQAARMEFDQGNFASACEKFAESNRLDPAPGTLLNLSLCLEKIGKVASAWEGFRQVAEKLHDERVDFARSKSASLEQRLPWLTLRLPAKAPPGTRVFRDGIELRSASLGVALPVDPGTHTLVVQAPDHLKWSSSITIEEGQREEVALEIGLPKPAESAMRSSKPTDLPAPESSQSRGNTTFAWISGGIGAAGITTSIVYGTLAWRNKQTLDAHCNDRICDETGLQAAASGRTHTRISTLAGAVGVIGLGVSTYLFATAEGTPTMSIEAATTNGGGHVNMTGRF